MLDTVNPYSSEIRCTLDIMDYPLHAKQPRSVRVYSDSVEVVKAVVRRLSLDGDHVFVEGEEQRAAIRASLGTEVMVTEDEPADAALVPFSLRKTSLRCERTIVAAIRNAISYKSLVYPGMVHTTAIGTLRRVRQQYQVDQVVGLYLPRFVALLTLALLVGKQSASIHFRLSDLAMQYLYDFSPMWRFCYVVIFAGQR